MVWKTKMSLNAFGRKRSPGRRVTSGPSCPTSKQPRASCRLLAPAGLTNVAGDNLAWQSVSGISYYIERVTNLGYLPAFSLLQSNIVGQPGTTTCTDTNAVGAGPFCYRVGVGNWGEPCALNRTLGRQRKANHILFPFVHSWDF
jgi:hypothetical protein